MPSAPLLATQTAFRVYLPVTSMSLKGLQGPEMVVLVTLAGFLISWTPAANAFPSHRDPT